MLAHRHIQSPEAVRQHRVALKMSDRRAAQFQVVQPQKGEADHAHHAARLVHQEVAQVCANFSTLMIGTRFAQYF